jgi:AAHS family 3-hydroxyphenylpropionic acid transporter
VEQQVAPARSGLVATLAICFVAAMCEGMDVQAAGVAAAGISHGLKPTPGQLGFFFTAANVGLLLGAVVGGRLADRIGRKPVLTASLLAFGVCSLLTAGAWDMTTLTLARLATGLGLGGAMPNMIALTADVTGARARNATVGLTYIGMPVGGGVTSLLALSLPAGQWRALFVIGGIAPLVVALLMAVMLREGAPQTASGRREAGPVSELFTEGRLARTLALWLGFFAAALTLHLMLNWLPLLLQGRGLTKADAAAAQVAFNLIGAGGALIAGLGLGGRWRPLSLLFAIAAAPIAILTVAEAPAALAAMVAAAGLLGAGVLALHVILYGAAGDCYPERIRGTGMGGVVAASRIGALSGPALAAMLLSAGRSPADVLASVLPVIVTAGACVAWLGWPRRAREAAVAAA